MPSGSQLHRAAAFLSVAVVGSVFNSTLLFVVPYGQYSHERNKHRCTPRRRSTHVYRKASRACSLEATKESIVAIKKNLWRAVIEVGFIIFLFYSNLLMGEFERSGMGLKRGVAWAIGDVVTAANFEIAVIAALIGYVLFEFL